jgi:hypothetical protein
MGFYDLDASSGKTRAEQLVDKDKDGSMQQEKVSAHAPSPVGDPELLARSLEYPSKFHASGLNDAFFADAFTHGASVQRLLNGWDTCEVDVHTRFEARARARRSGSDGKPPSSDFTYVGSFHVTAEELRSCRFDGDAENTPRVRVYDAGHHATDSLHADVVADADCPGSKREQKEQRHKLRVRLMKLAEERGLFVSPFLTDDEKSKAEMTQMQLNQSSEAVKAACGHQIAQSGEDGPAVPLLAPSDMPVPS